VEDVNQFPAVERPPQSWAAVRTTGKGRDRRLPGVGEGADVFAQLDQVLRTIMEKIDEFLRPDNWSLLCWMRPNRSFTTLSWRWGRPRKR